MKYNFDKMTDRSGTSSLKWDIKENELPMWVADMDFETAPEIVKAIEKRVKNGIFGYSIVPEAWNNAICNWWKNRHHYDMKPETLVFCTGVVPAISSIVRKMTTVGENVLIQTPVYNIFFNSILNNGRNVLESKLKYDGNEYSIDFDDLEKKLENPQTTLMLLCNPHNPVGKIWDKKTLKRIGDLCYKHNVLVVSDEIHCDLTDPDTEYIPFASISDKCANNSITCIAPTKTFNIAGLQTSAVMIPNPVIRHKVERGLNTDEVAEPNVFAIDAAIAAFTYGGKWLDSLREYIYENKMLVKSYIEKEIPQIKLVPSQATYLLWLDCEGFVRENDNFAQFVRKESGLWLSEGKVYGNGDKFLRMNIACQCQRVEEGLERLKKSVEAYIK